MRTEAAAERTVALVRGPFLNPYDMAPYQRLEPGLRAHAFAARRCFTESEAVGVPVTRLRCPETELSVRHGRRLNFAPWFFGRGYMLMGLQRALEGTGVINTAETYFGFSLQAARASRRLGVPLVVTVKETIPDVERVHPWRRRGLERNVKEEVKSQAALFIAVSQAAASALQQEGVSMERVEVVPPAVDCEHFSPSPRPADGVFRMLFVGPALWRKGLLEAVRALPALGRLGPAVLTIVGRGGDLGEAFHVAERLGVRGAIEAVGIIPHRQMPAQFRRSDVLVAPSIPTRTWQEQDSLAVLEAMACGLPVVATPGGIRRELLGPEGYWAAPGDFVELAERLVEVATDRDQAERRGRALRERAVERHSLPRVAACLSRCYRRVIE